MSLKLAAIFKDFMVVQRNRPITVFGTGVPKTVVTVSLHTSFSKTVVAADGEILGKPKDKDDARRMINKISGTSHQVYTGVTVLIKKNGKWEDISFSESTDVSFYPVSDEEIRTYIASGEPMDKAGSYGIQGGFGIYVKEIRGEYTNVVGLPVGRLFYEMKKHGIELRG